jgi:sugar lactone lactonase YvrE
MNFDNIKSSWKFPVAGTEFPCYTFHAASNVRLSRLHHPEGGIMLICSPKFQVLVAALSIGVSTAAAIAQTDFGPVDIGSKTSAAVSVAIPSPAKLGSISVRTLGAENLDYTNAGAGTCSANVGYATNATCTVNVAFSPKYPGLRYGAVVLLDASGTIIGYTYLQGSGQGPQFHYQEVETTLLGSVASPGNMTVDGNGNIYVAITNSGLSEVIELTPSGGSYTQQVFTSTFASLGGIAVDGVGNFYIAENDGFVHKFTPSGSGYIESTFGNGMNLPNGISFDASGNVYIADAYNGRVLKETLTAGSYVQSDILDCGTPGEQTCPSSVASDANGDLFITAYDNSQILVMTPSTNGYAQSYIGSGLVWPSDIVIDGQGNLYIADTLNSRIVKESLAAGNYTQSVVPTGSAINWPWGLGVDDAGNVYIADTYNSRVLKEDFSDAPALTFGATSPGVLSPDSPQTVTIENGGNMALGFSAITYPGDFIADNPTAGFCETGTLLAPGETCAVGIGFKPLAEPASGNTVSEDVTITAGTAGIPQQSIQVTGTVGPPASHMTLTSSPAGSVVAGQSVNLTATVMSTSGNPAPAGTVTFTLGSTSLGSSNLGSSGVAILTTTSLPAGTDAIAASYPGDTLYGNGSASLSIAVTAAQPTLTVSASPSPGVYGQVTTLTATLRGYYGSANGETVTFYSQGKAIGTGTLSAGLATLNISTLPLGTSSLTAAYPGDSNDAGATSNTVSYTVNLVSPVLTSPAPGSRLPGSAALFVWTPGSGVTVYSLSVGTRWPGSEDIFSSGSIHYTSQTVTGLPTDGVPVYVMLRFLINGVVYTSFYTYTAAGSPTLPALIMPSPGSHLASSTVTFQWSPGAGPTAYALNVGTKWPGSDDIYGSGVTTATSAAVSGLPTDGVKVYVLLRYYLNGVWTDLNYTYTAEGSTAPPVMTTPAPGSVLSGSSVTFNWTPGTGVTAYALSVGTYGPGYFNIYSSPQLATTSGTVPNIPTDSKPVYVTLRYLIEGIWKTTNYTYTAASPAPSTNPAIISPPPGSTLPGSTASFSWTAGVDPIDNIQTIYFDVTRSDHMTLIYSGQYGPYGAGAVVSGIPTDGETIYVDLTWLTTLGKL